MNEESESPQGKVALLDTTVHVDFIKMPSRKAALQSLLLEFDWTITTCISLLEFKAVLIQECITIHNRLHQSKRFTFSRDALVESGHRQSRLRSHIFSNLIGVFAQGPGEISKEDDARLAEKARLALEGIIPRLYQWFVKQATTGGVLDRKIQCTRAKEPPVKKRVAFQANLPNCRRFGKNVNKFCRVEEFIRTEAESIVGLNHDSDQLTRSLEVIENVVSDESKELSHSDCRRAGDTLIALEGRHHATHAVSTNKSEWKPLSDHLGLEFVRPDYPDG